MEVVTLIAFFFGGLLAGVILVASIVIHYGKTILSKDKSDTPKDGKLTVNERMKKVKELTNAMVDLVAQIDGPQKNGLDGKYKNRLMAQLKTLDEEKNEIFRSIIRDGHDPELKAVDEDGTVTQMKLSQFMVQTGITMEPKQDIKAPESPKSQHNSTRLKNLGKFTVIKGGKDDGEKL